MAEIGMDCNCPEERPRRPATRYHEQVNITKVENGFIVQVGCKTFVTHEWAEVYRSLGEYWEDPIKAQEKYCR